MVIAGANRGPVAGSPAAGVRRFRKRPVEIEAIQWTGANLTEVRAFCGGSKFGPCDPAEPQSHDATITAHVFDVLHESWVGVKTGQWVIRGVAGEFYPIDEAVLAETYEPVADVQA
jgi:hypothetical protein